MESWRFSEGETEGGTAASAAVVSCGTLAAFAEADSGSGECIEARREGFLGELTLGARSCRGWRLNSERFSGAWGELLLLVGLSLRSRLSAGPSKESISLLRCSGFCWAGVSAVAEFERCFRSFSIERPRSILSGA